MTYSNHVIKNFTYVLFLVIFDSTWNNLFLQKSKIHWKRNSEWIFDSSYIIYVRNYYLHAYLLHFIIISNYIFLIRNLISCYEILRKLSQHDIKFLMARGTKKPESKSSSNQRLKSPEGRRLQRCHSERLGSHGSSKSYAEDDS